MLKTLADGNDFESFLILAEAVLAVRPREDTEETPRFQDTPFYFNYLSLTKIFGLIAAVGTKFAERALVFTTVKLAEIMVASDQFLLLEVDFFTLDPGPTDGWVWQADVRELAAAAKALAVRLIGERCAESADVRRIYKEHLASLPESRVIRRLCLFVLSLCPQAFREELKQAFSPCSRLITITTCRQGQNSRRIPRSVGRRQKAFRREDFGYLWPPTR